VPSVNCSLLINQTCLAEYVTACPYRAPLGSGSANTTGLVGWLNASASACGTPPIFAESTFVVAVEVADSLILEFLDPGALALSIFLNASVFAMPATSHLSVYEQRINGTAFLQLGRTELAGLGLSDGEVDSAVTWRVEMASGCACVTEAGRTFTSAYYLPSKRCVAQLRALCVLAEARGEVCAYAAPFFPEGLAPAYVIQNYYDPFDEAIVYNVSSPLGAVLAQNNPNASLLWVPLIAELAQTCPGGRPYLTEKNLHSFVTNQFTPPFQLGFSELAAQMFIQPNEWGMLSPLAGDPPVAADRFYAQRLNGEDWNKLSQLAPDDLSKPPLNLETLEAQSFIDQADGFKNTYNEVPKAPSGQLIPEVLPARVPFRARPCPSVRVLDHFSPWQVSIQVQFDKLVDVYPPTYFTAEFTVQLSWHDNRITRSCPFFFEGEEPDAACKTFWTPKLSFPTALGNDDAPQYLQNTGYAFFAGSDPAEITLDDGSVLVIAGQHEELQVPGLKQSVGLVTFKMRASFYSTLSYKRFPFDSQQLNMTFELESGDAASSSSSKICLSPQWALPDAAKNTHPVWGVRSIETAVGNVSRFIAGSGEGAFSAGSGVTPLASVYTTISCEDDEAVCHDPAYLFIKTLGLGFDAVEACRATFIVNVDRVRTYYSAARFSNSGEDAPHSTPGHANTFTFLQYSTTSSSRSSSSSWPSASLALTQRAWTRASRLR
jgi:hypothetical protein